MKKGSPLDILNQVQENKEPAQSGERYLLIDGLNLFFRNFAILNMVNSKGQHIGGLGGFLRSLGVLIRQIQPTQVYIVFDGAGSSNNRKNLLPEYKSGRHTKRITKIVRLVHYLKTLPVKVVSIDKVEADDIIAYYSQTLCKSPKDKAFIVSSDRDFIQLINENVAVFRPIEKEFYTPDTVKEKFGIPAGNFILYKTLLGDNSDGIRGIKGLGKKSFLKKFPELAEDIMSLDDVIGICESKFKENITYARVIDNIDEVNLNYKLMDLSNPMIDASDKLYLDSLANDKELNYIPEAFLEMYEEDQVGGIIRNVGFWVKDVFEQFKN
jgi:DNA polymerase-1